MIKRLIAAELAEFYARDDSHGYSQPHRLGKSWTQIRLSDGTPVNVQTGDMDCSRLVQICYYGAGVLDAAAGFWTGIMPERLKQAGFVACKTSPQELRRGDVLLRDGHTAIYVGGMRIVEAARSETGGIDGATGDQDGLEVRVSDYDPTRWPWAYSYRLDEDLTLIPERKIASIIKVKDSAMHYYFDGAELHGIATPSELAALDSLGTLARVELDQVQINAIAAVLKR